MSKKAKKSKPAVQAASEGTISAFVVPLILAGDLAVEAIVARVCAKFPKSKFKPSHVYWHRQHLKALGKRVPDLVGGVRAPKKAAPKKAAPRKSRAKNHVPAQVPATGASEASQEA